MPTYEYMCASCKHEWEATHSMTRAPLKTCPKCKRRTAKRQISLGQGFILKGGGWYADLYGSSGSGGSSGGSNSEGKSDSSSKDKSAKKSKKSDKKKSSTKGASSAASAAA